ncbi:MAG TPA: sigma-70 family RNA polymerase sigma factor [Anaerolineales bacterium]|jgi:RNA polymerase sigma-70 factor (ECF subfamily)|nr:sigma-70 family RNA polymerase sigma factor [Anaerolineales bacterium]
MKSSEDYARYSDEMLVRLIAQSHEQALAQLYDRYNRLIFSLALAIVNDRESAEEITLDVFMRVWQKAGTYRVEQAKVSTWLTHIARHHSIDVLRRRAARLDQSAVHWEDVIRNVESSLPSPQESAELSSRRARIQGALARLPAEQKQALLLAYFGGYTQSQIAEILAQPLGTIKTRLRLAMQKLREFLKEEQGYKDKSVAPHSAYNNIEE